MRTLKSEDEWKGVWIAGFSGLKAGGRRNALVYLMKVARAHISHHDLWDSLNTKERSAKAADKNTFGDVYRPERYLREDKKFDPRCYHAPCPSHVHLNEKCWHEDINYTKRPKRQPALLVGGANHSFLWKEPKIFLPTGTSIGRGHRRCNLGDLLGEKLSEIRR
jgi:hypothetical protein